MCKKLNEIKEKIVPVAEKYGLEAVYLFGSQRKALLPLVLAGAVPGQLHQALLADHPGAIRLVHLHIGVAALALYAGLTGKHGLTLCGLSRNTGCGIGRTLLKVAVSLLRHGNLCGCLLMRTVGIKEGTLQIYDFLASPYKYKARILGNYSYRNSL